MADSKPIKALRKFVDISGRRFGRLTVIRFSRLKGGRQTWICLCDCGVQKEIIGRYLKSGRSTSCGCYRQELATKNATIHGYTGTREFASWTSAIDRCTNPNSPKFKHYGGRGITMCQRWRESFTAFISDMGPRPPKMSLDRINNDGNYEPGNCRWATQSQQCKNRRKPIAK